jgi:hypothetical protein
MRAVFLEHERPANTARKRSQKKAWSSSPVAAWPSRRAASSRPRPVWDGWSAPRTRSPRSSCC